MSEATVLIHGWSDCSASFARMGKYLERELQHEVFFADYESREENMTFEDVVDGLNDQFIEKGFIDRGGKKLRDVNVVVHSTGGLVIRHWIWRYYVRDKARVMECPVRRVVMLAPCNFGSPLAHRGRSFLGRLTKGRKKITDFLEVGSNFLDGLELASPYAWELAHRDVLGNELIYATDRIQLTILVGLEQYGGLKRLLKSPGTDGTVVVSGTSLDYSRFELNFLDANKVRDHSYFRVTNPPDDFAFGIIDNANHLNIVDDFEINGVGGLLKEALKTDHQGFQDLKKKLDQTTVANSDRLQLQQFVLHAQDDQGLSISDFEIDFYVTDANGVHQPELEDRVHEAILNFHAHKRDPSYRAFLVDVNEVNKAFQDAQRGLGDFVLSMGIQIPPVDKGIHFDSQLVPIHDTRRDDNERFFFNNTTTLVDLIVNRGNTYVTVGKEPKHH